MADEKAFADTIASETLGSASSPAASAIPLVGEDRSSVETATFLGTPHYMAPEQVDGKRPIGPRTDLYALGALLFEILHLQLAAEAHAQFGAAEDALEFLEGSVRPDLVDLVWFDHCAAVDSLRSDPRFVGLRAQVEARVGEVQDLVLRELAGPSAPAAASSGG